MYEYYLDTINLKVTKGGWGTGQFSLLRTMVYMHWVKMFWYEVIQSSTREWVDKIAKLGLRVMRAETIIGLEAE